MPRRGLIIIHFPPLAEARRKCYGSALTEAFADMKTISRVLAVLLAAGALAAWLATGASHGWTKTSVPVRQTDAVTGIEGITYESRFVPGVDFLGGALLASALLAGLSLLLCNRSKPTANTSQNL